MLRHLALIDGLAIGGGAYPFLDLEAPSLISSKIFQFFENYHLLTEYMIDVSNIYISLYHDKRI